MNINSYFNRHMYTNHFTHRNIHSEKRLKKYRCLAVVFCIQDCINLNTIGCMAIRMRSLAKQRVLFPTAYNTFTLTVINYTLENIKMHLQSDSLTHLSCRLLKLQRVLSPTNQSHLHLSCFTQGIIKTYKKGSFFIDVDKNPKNDLPSNQTYRR